MTHAILTMATLQQIVGTIKAGSKQESNALSMLDGLDAGGFEAGLNKPHRLAKYLGQIILESGRFVYDREIWGNTAAQQRYDIRTDLGNTPERDGDGYKYRGRTPIQITGKSNYRQFTAWCRKWIDPNAPDFVAVPDAANTDPWEGLGPIWYWSTRKLNKWADQNNVREITRRINGGYNHLAERQKWTDRASLVLLGYGSQDVRAFQAAAGIAVDGAIGPQTRAKMHEALVKLPAAKESGRAVIPAPILTPEQANQGKVGGGVAVGGAAAALAASHWDKIESWFCALPLIGNICGG